MAVDRQLDNELGLTVDNLEQVQEKLQEALGTNWVSNDPAVLTCYFRDFTARVGKWPNIVVLPASTEEVQAVMRIAFEHKVPVVPLSTDSNGRVTGPRRLSRPERAS